MRRKIAVATTGAASATTADTTAVAASSATAYMRASEHLPAAVAVAATFAAAFPRFDVAKFFGHAESDEHTRVNF